MRWTDKLVKEFVKVATAGQYGAYHDCYSVDMKMKRFKKVKNTAYWLGREKEMLCKKEHQTK